VAGSLHTASSTPALPRSHRIWCFFLYVKQSTLRIFYHFIAKYLASSYDVKSYEQALR
jgi:hypothetical protein